MFSKYSVHIYVDELLERACHKLTLKSAGLRAKWLFSCEKMSIEINVPAPISLNEICIDNQLLPTT